MSRRRRLEAAVCLAAALGAGSIAFADIRTITGGPGPDVIDVGPEAARVLGGPGADRLRGGPQADDLNGNAGDDSLDGGGGNDTLRGGRDADSLSGGAGDDWLSGDRGDDVLTGGPGADRFVLALDGGRDLVTDFSAAEGDRIEIDAPERPQIVAGSDGAVVRLSDGSQLQLKGVPAAGLERWLVQAAPPAPAAQAPAAPREESPALVIVVILALLAVAGALGVFVLRRRH
ncbi:MAG: hemolysin-type calcium-binding region protein [Phenylobacterium sp.]|nr:hemolysin-type calcium-binding region protein [Phenylobacterium sp.]